MQMFHDDARKTIYFGVKRSKDKVAGNKTIAGMGLCTFVSAGWLFVVCDFIQTETYNQYITLVFDLPAQQNQ